MGAACLGLHPFFLLKIYSDMKKKRFKLKRKPKIKTLFATTLKKEKEFNNIAFEFLIFIYKNKLFLEDINIKNVCKSFGCNSVTVSNSIKYTFGLTLSEFIDMLKLLHAISYVYKYEKNYLSYSEILFVSKASNKRIIPFCLSLKGYELTDLLKYGEHSFDKHKDRYKKVFLRKELERQKEVSEFINRLNLK